jgi:MFS family permease
MILLCLSISSVGMFASAFSQNAVQLGLLRALTGVGIGGILASSNVIASEFANARWRGLAVSLNSTGYAIGATLGGLVAVVLLAEAGWRSVFLFGGICTAALIPLVYLRLPESLDFLLARRPADALQRINTFAVRAGQQPLAELPATGTAHEAQTGNKVAALLARPQRRTTILVWIAFFLTMFGFYFVTSWTPKLLVEAGLSANQGVTGGTLLNLGGIFGATVLGALSARFALTKVLAAYMVIAGVLLALFVPATTAIVVAFAIGALIGVFINGCVAGLYALTPTVYPSAIRATGVGWAIGIGRIGAITSPIAAGALLDRGWSPGQLYIAVAVALVLAAVVVIAMRHDRQSSRVTSHQARSSVSR